MKKKRRKKRREIIPSSYIGWIRPIQFRFSYKKKKTLRQKNSQSQAYIIRGYRNNILVKLEYSEDDCYVKTEDATESN